MTSFGFREIIWKKNKNQNNITQSSQSSEKKKYTYLFLGNMFLFSAFFSLFPYTDTHKNTRNRYKRCKYKSKFCQILCKKYHHSSKAKKEIQRKNRHFPCSKYLHIKRKESYRNGCKSKRSKQIIWNHESRFHK